MMASFAAGSDSAIERRIISVSSKRQVTIPIKYFEALDFDNEAECILQDGGIFIRPVRTGSNDFAEQILEDLITQGYSGGELLAKFKEQNKKIRPAVEALIAEADALAKTDEAKISLNELFEAEGE